MRLGLDQIGHRQWIIRIQPIDPSIMGQLLRWERCFRKRMEIEKNHTDIKHRTEKRNIYTIMNPLLWKYFLAMMVMMVMILASLAQQELRLQARWLEPYVAAKALVTTLIFIINSMAI